LVEETVIKLVVGFDMSNDDFSEELQNVFIEALSESTLIPFEQIEITSIDSIINTTDGSLLASGISVAVEFVVENVTRGRDISTQMTPVLLNTKIAEKGLPAMDILVHASVETVMKIPAIVIPAPDFVRRFVFRMLLSVVDFQIKQIAFKRVLASAFAVSLPKVTITSVTVVDTGSSRRRLLATEIDVGVEVRFPSLAHSQTPAPLSAINTGLMLEGLPIATVITSSSTSGVVANDGPSSTILNLPTAVIYTIAACAAALVLTVIIVVVFCIHRPGSQYHTNTNTAASYSYFAPPPQDQSNGVSDVISRSAFSPYAVSYGDNSYTYSYIDQNGNAYAC